MTPPHLKFTSW